MSKKRKIILIGGGGHSLSVADVVVNHSSFELAGFVDNDEHAKLSKTGAIWLGTDQFVRETKIQDFHIAIGQIKQATTRAIIYDRLTDFGKTLPVIKSKVCYISSSAGIGNGCLVMHGTLVNAFAKVHSNTILNTGAVIEHGAKIGKHCHIAPRAVILGDAVVGSNTFIGSGAIVCEGVCVGENVIVGAGEVVKKDVKDHAIIRSQTIKR